MDKETKIALGLMVAGMFYSQHIQIKAMRKHVLLMDAAVRSHFEAHRQANVDVEFNRIVKNFDRW